MAKESGAGRRRLGALVAVALSVVLGVTAATTVYVVVRRYTAQLDEIRESASDQILVPVPLGVVGAGTVLLPEHLQMIEIDAAFVPLTAETRMEGLVGRTVVERLLPGEFVRAERLARPDGGQGLSALIPTGMRAVSLDLADGAQVSGFIEPGDGVDVLVTFQEEEEIPAETLTLLQGVRVLAVNEKVSETLQGQEIRQPTVTVAIPPADVEKVTHALEIGRAMLTLRAVIDMTHQETHGATVTELLGREKTRLTVQQYRERVTEADVTRMIEMIHGAEKSKEKALNVDPKLLRPVATAP